MTVLDDGPGLTRGKATGFGLIDAHENALVAEGLNVEPELASGPRVGRLSQPDSEAANRPREDRLVIRAVVSRLL